MSESPTKNRIIVTPVESTVGSRGDVTVVADPRHDDRIGMEIGKYVVTRRLGRGGMGIVYEAQDKVLRRRVAIKFFAEAVAVTREAVKRFVQEAQAAARLNHPNVVAVYEVGQRDGIYFLVMELVPGVSAEEHLKRTGRLDWMTATRVTAAACRALAAAHAAQLIHRDIKPANLLLSPDLSSGDSTSSRSWLVKLGDFGLAKLVDGAMSMATAADRVLGTPNYMSPEQCRSEALDPRTDLYSLGATYYSLLTGKPPFVCDQPVQVMFAHCWTSAPDPRATDAAIPEACSRVVQRAMAKDPHDRYSTAQEMLADLQEALRAARLVPPDHDIPQGALPPTDRDAPPFSRPLGFTAPNEAHASTAADTAPAKAGRRGWRRRQRIISAGVLLALVATAGGLNGWGRMHGKPGGWPFVGAGSPSAGRVSFLPDACRWAVDAGGSVSQVLFTPDGRRVIATISDGAGGVDGWEAADGHPYIAILANKPCGGAAFPPGSDGHEIFVAQGSTIVRWSLVQEARHDLPMHVSSAIGQIVWGGSSSGKHVMAVLVKPADATGRNSLRLFDENLRELEFSMPGGRDVNALCFLGNTPLMATGSSDMKIRRWEINRLEKSSSPIFDTFDDDVSVYLLASNADGSVIAAAGRQSTQFFLSKRDSTIGQQPFGRVLRPNHNCRSLALSPDGMTAAVGSGSDKAGDVSIYDVNTSEMIAEITGFNGAVTAAAFSPDGAVLATGSMDHTVKVWDLARLLPDRAGPRPSTRPVKTQSP